MGLPKLRMASQLSQKSDSKIPNGQRTAESGLAPPAAANTSEPEQPLPFEAVLSGPSSSSLLSAKSSDQPIPDLSAINWEIPPIRWGGNANSNYSWNDSQGAGATSSQVQTVNLHGSSYIYQPWYAQVSGNVGLLAASAQQSSGDISANSNPRTTALTYGGNLSLFPQSRFPFQAYVQTSDSRASANVQGQQYTSTRMGARQNYRPEVGTDSFSANAEHSKLASATFSSVVDAIQGTYSTSIADHQLSSYARFSRTQGSVGDQRSNLLSLNGTHSWRAEEGLSVGSSVSFSNNQIYMLSGTSLFTNDSQVLQAASSVTWIPDEELPLTIVGGGGFLRIGTATEAAKVDLSNLYGYLNANYRFSAKVSTTAGLTLAQIQSNGTSTLTSGQNASVSDSGDSLIIGDYSYNWGAGSGFNNQITSGGTNNSNLFGQIQHSLLRSIALDKDSVLALNAGQSFSLIHDRTSGQSGLLNMNAGASWQMGLGEGAVGMLNATVSDFRTSGSFASHFQNFSAQGSVQTQIGRYAALAASLNVVVSRQLTSTQVTQTTVPAAAPFQTVNKGNTVNGSGQITYSHRNPFDISNLFYTATFQTNTSQTNLRLISGDPNALAWQTGTVFQQNLDYRLGRLTFRVTNSFTKVSGKENASIFFSVGREIGDL